MSRIPGAGSGIPPPNSSKRLSRQPSLDLRRKKHADQAPPPPVPALKASKSNRMSRASISSYDEAESPISSRYSLSSIGSTQTAMTSPRSSFTSPKPTGGRQRLSKQQAQPICTSPTPVQLRVNDRIAVDSMGIVGTLKFLGPTQFKDGLWAGIQLDFVGSGKNDGAVGGYLLPKKKN